MTNTSRGIDVSTKAAEAEWDERFFEGPTRTRWTEVPVQLGDEAPTFELRDQTGTVRSLDEFWADGPALVCFWRHFGCNCGIGRAERLAEELSDLRAAGANVVIVGQAEPERAAVYAEKYDVTVPILSDPDYEAYKAYGLLEFSPAQVLQDAPDEILHLERDATAELVEARRDMDQPMVDNPWQAPGEFVVDESGTIRLAYRYQYCEDYPDPDVLLTAISEAQR